MSAAQWAPWVSVFLGGCLSGAALLSLTSERADGQAQVVTVNPPPSVPDESDDPDEGDELDEHVTVERDATEARATADHVGDPELAESGESEHGPSAADILAALEQAYQRQVAAAAAKLPVDPVPVEVAIAEVEAEVEVAPAPAVPPSAPAVSRDDRVVAIDTARDTEDEPARPDPVQVAMVEPVESQPPVQQVVVYQPVYVLPPNPQAAPTNTAPRRRAVGRDPWAPLNISPRHNPWGSASGAGAWTTVGVAGGVWAGGSAPRR